MRSASVRHQNVTNHFRPNCFLEGIASHFYYIQSGWRSGKKKRRRNKDLRFYGENSESERDLVEFVCWNECFREMKHQDKWVEKLVIMEELRIRRGCLKGIKRRWNNIWRGERPSSGWVEVRPEQWVMAVISWFQVSVALCWSELWSLPFFFFTCKNQSIM